MAATRIFLAADALAYVPVFLTERLGREIDDAKHWEGEFQLAGVPAEADLPVDAQAWTGDQRCAAAIAQAARRGEHAIGICDPCELPALPNYGDELCVAAGLIRRACFWGVGTRDLVSTVKRPQDLAVEHLIVQDRGYTGWHVGDRYWKQFSPRRPRLYEGSFESVIDGAVDANDNGHKGVLAMSASILSAVLAEESRGLHILFPAWALDEIYGDFLTTGVVVARSSLKEDAFRDRLAHFLFGLLEACRDLKSKLTRELIAEICKDETRFIEERKLGSAKFNPSLGRLVATSSSPSRIETVSTTAAAAAYNHLIRSDLYALDGEITARQWENAGRARESLNWPPLSAYFDRSALDRAKRLTAGGLPTRGLKKVAAVMAALAICAVAFLIAGWVQSFAITLPLQVLILALAAGILLFTGYLYFMLDPSNLHRRPILNFLGPLLRWLRQHPVYRVYVSWLGTASFGWFSKQLSIVIGL